MSRFEWRVLWAAGSSIGFRGETEWMPWDGDEETVDDVMTAALEPQAPGGAASLAEEVWWDAARPEFWVEVREVKA